MSKRKSRMFVGDFETTVYEGQTDTQVWAGAVVELYSENVKIFGSIMDTLDYIVSLNDNIICYFHNLKFDGEFWLYYLISVLKLKQAYDEYGENNIEWRKDKFMDNNTFKYMISEKGQFYSLTLKIKGKYIEFRDSYKILPFNLKRIGQAFKTKHQKLDMEYKGFRYPNCPRTEEEDKYIANDVLVIKEAMEIMLEQGHDKPTIGSCCLEEFKKTYHKDDYNTFFPPLNTEMCEELNISFDEYVRNSYKGGWCYVVEGEESKLFKHGLTADVNSLYPSMMHSMSGNRYPVGSPHFWQGNFIHEKAIGKNKYFFIRIKTRFYIRENYLPFIQIKQSRLYKGNECLKSSDIYNKYDGKYYDKYYDKDGNLCDTRVELTLTMTDYELMKEHYELVDFEILDGVWFYSEIGLFDTYINKYKEIKQNSVGALREQAKLFLNNLYGKFASSDDSSFKVAFLKPNGVIGYKNIEAHEKNVGYIPIGSAITSYARNFTIRTAQKNFHGVGTRGFKYADTDSIHCDLTVDELIDVPLHKTEFCHWSLECGWEHAIFTRQKTYIEYVTHKMNDELGLTPVKEPFYDVKCAGMSEKSKGLFIESVTGKQIVKRYKLNDMDKQFLENNKLKLTDFKAGLRVSGSLKPKRIRGGVLLVEDYYEMR